MLLPCPPVPLVVGPVAISPPPPLLPAPLPPPSTSLSASSLSLSLVCRCPPSLLGYYLGHQASRRSRARPPTCACPRNIRNTVAITRHRPVAVAALCGNVANPLRSSLRLFLGRFSLDRSSPLSLSLSIRASSRLADCRRQVRAIPSRRSKQAPRSRLQRDRLRNLHRLRLLNFD